MITLPFAIRFEQAVYGSFAFWGRGYSVLARSAGCRPEWLTELRTVCQRFGEPPFGVHDAESLLAIRLKSGPWMIVGVHSQGDDDLDRPGALAFHALFVSRWAYRLAGANPFALAGALRGDWSLADCDRILPPGTFAIGESKSGPVSMRTDDPRLPAIVSALIRRRRVVVQSNEPIDELAQSVWHALPRSTRCRVSVATWAFDNENLFDFVAMPKLAGVELSSADLVLALEPTGL
jgi:hypothetical protein